MKKNQISNPFHKFCCSCKCSLTALTAWFLTRWTVSQHNGGASLSSGFGAALSWFSFCRRCEQLPQLHCVPGSQTKIKQNMCTFLCWSELREQRVPISQPQTPITPLYSREGMHRQFPFWKPLFKIMTTQDTFSRVEIISCVRWAFLCELCLQGLRLHLHNTQTLGSCADGEHAA